MTKTMLIDAANPEEVRVCLLQNGKVEDFDFEYASRKPLRGNIYLARVTRVEPSLQAAFIEYGGNRHGFLAFNEIHPDYYQIPVSDRQAIKAAEEEEAALAAQLNLSPQTDDDDGGLAELEEEVGSAGESESESEGGERKRRRSRRSGRGPRAEASAESAEQSGEETADDGSFNEDTEDAAAPDGAEAVFDDDANADGESHDASLDDNNDDDDDEDEEEDLDGDEDEDGDDEDDDEDDASAADESDDDESDDDDQSDAELTASDDSVEAFDDEAPEDDEDSESEPEEEQAPLDPKVSRAERAALIERYKEARRKRMRLIRNYKIQEVIKRRQILLVQVVKEERGNKGAALTTYLSLAGRYCVLMPNTARGGGISRKIPMASDRKRLRRIVDDLDVPGGMGLIIRTAGAKRTKAEIKRDYEYLVRLWENIRALTLQSIAPALIYEEANLIKRAIRDLYDKDVGMVLVEGENGYREAKDFMRMLMPSHAKNVQPFKDRAPLFLKYGVESQLDAMYQPIVRLKSGGYIVINQTEALIAIDVNSGKSTRERNIEQTALRTNLEAADEAARQFRLRDLAGLIVVDFIDMEEGRNNRAVEKRLKDALRADRARIQVGRISNFGLLEMSRQRRRSGIVDGTTHSCPACGGAGVVRSNEMAALRILRAVESEANAGRSGRLSVSTARDVALYVLNHKREWLRRIEDQYGVTVELLADEAKAGDQYVIEKSGARRDVAEGATVVRADTTETIDAPVEAVEEDADDVDAEAREDASEESSTRNGDGEQSGRKRRRRRRRSGRRDENDGDRPMEARGQPPRDAEAQGADIGTEGESDQPYVEEQSAETVGERSRRRRRRGRRGGRRNGRQEDGAIGEEAAVGAPEPDTAYADDNGAEFFDRDAVIDDREIGDAAPVATPPQEAHAPQMTPEAAPEAAPAAPAAEEAAKRDKPTRRGWWNRIAG